MKKFNHKEWRKKNRKKINKKTREKYKQLSAQVKQIAVDFYNKKDIRHYPFEVKKEFARRIAHRIKITDKSFCEKCGKKRKEIRLEKHHPNYNFPLRVRILCTKCHKKITNRNKKRNRNKKIKIKFCSLLS
jgi:hypothetical protein